VVRAARRAPRSRDGVTPLGAPLRRRIADSGPLSLADYMAEALGHPEYGYYATRDPLGAAGDFTTAPEISQVFGELIGAWCVEVWRAMGAPDPVLVVELGPGRGTLVADAGRTWRRIAPEFASAARLHLIEINPILRARQRETLAAVATPLAWHAKLAEVPGGPMILLANEFFDALPLRQYVRRGDGWRERLVGTAPSHESFAFVDGPIVDPAAVLEAAGEDVRRQFEAAADGEIVELCPMAESLAADIGARLVDHGGAALVVDYGPTRSALGDTLQAVCGHRYADPLAAPGGADLSHHVDFARLRAAAERRGARVWGPIPQGLLLGRLGFAARAEALAAATPSASRAEAIRGAVRRLVHPGRMGVLFKALAIAHPSLQAPPGFAAGPA
jgi:NADH dehydrogenase [ubiquinone] 1 alpha subcomplex assembly factor 7